MNRFLCDGNTDFNLVSDEDSRMVTLKSYFVTRRKFPLFVNIFLEENFFFKDNNINTKLVCYRRHRL